MKISKILLTIGVIIFIAIAYYYGKSSNTNVNKDFAQCLSENGAKMYGAYWCPHCENQKQMFGDGREYINYIECSLPDGAGQTNECGDAGIRGYPTWEFADGGRVEGELSLEELSEKSGCKIK